ncbi:MAG TPA: DUF4406 domain-containing protein [Anaerolineae bacterium]
MATKKFIYIAGPMSQGDYIQNLRRGMDAWRELLAAGCTPFCPHLSAFLYLVYQEEHTYAQWLSYDFQWLSKCDALLRLPGPSYGADQEVAFAQAHAIPVYHSIPELLQAIRTVEEGSDDGTRVTEVDPAGPVAQDQADRSA